MPADRWEKAADRDLARRQRDVGPLFAPLVERRPSAEVQARAEAIVEKHLAAIRDPDRAARLKAQGQADRATVAAHVSAEELAELDRRRSWCPATAEYTADFWRDQCRKRGLPWATKATEAAFWAPINAAVDAHRRREEAKRAAAGEQLDLPSGVRIGLSRARIEAMTAEEQEALEEAAEAELQVAQEGAAR